MKGFKSRLPKPTIYILPSLFTLGNMGLGLFSVVNTMGGKYYIAALCVIYAHALDILDGRIARWASAQSAFGVEFDSLADWISFGIAPSMLLYQMALKDIGAHGFLLALMFVLCGGVRLARFNLGSQEREKSELDHPLDKHFTGLPIPAAGGFLASVVLVQQLTMVPAIRPDARTIPVVLHVIPAIFNYLPEIAVVLSLLMVSRIPHTSFKQLSLLKPKTILSKTLTVLIVGGLVIYPQCTAFTVYAAYLVWSMFLFIFIAYQEHRGKSQET